MLLKPFSGVLPVEFQFIGLWLALCFVLQGYVGAALASTVTKDPRHQILAACLLVLSPVLVRRIGHDTLCAHWLLLALLYFGFREYSGPAPARRALLLAAGAALLAAGIHPYLAAMCWMLAMACYARLWLGGLVTPLRALTAGLLTTAGMIAVFAMFGYFSGGPIGASGFGRYSADLLTLVNPTEYSRLLPSLRMNASQYEGLGFVGLGGLVAMGLGAAVFVRRRSSLRAGTWPVVAACLLMGIYALSEAVAFAGREVLSLRSLYEPLTPLVAPFRASGRFIWPLHYLMLVFGAWGLTRAVGSARPRAVTVLMALAVALQFADIQPDPESLGPKAFRQAPFQDFALAAGRFRHLAVVPMQVLGVCGDPIEEDRVYRYMLLAYRLKTTFNSGVFARVPADRVARECVRTMDAIETMTLDPQTIYIVSSDHVPRFQTAGALCGRFDGDWICVARDSDERFRTWVETGRVIEVPGSTKRE